MKPTDAEIPAAILTLWRDCGHAWVADDCERYADGSFGAVPFLRGVARSARETADACPDADFVIAQSKALAATEAFLATHSDQIGDIRGARANRLRAEIVGSARVDEEALAHKGSAAEAARIYTVTEVQALLKGTTPGPWRHSRSHDDAHGWLYLVSNGCHEVARVIDGQGSEEIHDTKLIAAAPDLARTVIALSEETARLRAEVSGWRDLPNVGQVMHALDIARNDAAALRVAAAGYLAARKAYDTADATHEAETWARRDAAHKALVALIGGAP